MAKNAFTQRPLRWHARELKTSFSFLSFPLLLAIAACPASAAQMYRCTEGGTVVFADRPCGDNAKAIDVKPPTGPLGNRAETPARAGENKPPSTQARRAPADPGRQGVDPAEARKAEREQGALVQCFTDAYNAWFRGQNPRPSPEARDAQMTKLQQDCRRRYPDVPTGPPPEPRQASAPLDSFLKAIKSGDVNAVKALLDAKADPNAVFMFPDSINTQLRSPALLYSVNNSTEEVTQLLLERGASVRGTNESGITALHAAATWGRTKTMGLLLSRGAEIAARNAGGHTPLHSAVHGMQIESVRYLVSKGAPVDARDSQQQTPLFVAIMGNVRNDRLPIIRQLIKLGANPNLPDAHGDYPLHAAVVGRGQAMPEVVRDLIDAGAKVDVANGSGEIPLALAERLGRSNVTSILKSASARPRGGPTPPRP